MTCNDHQWFVEEHRAVLYVFFSVKSSLQICNVLIDITFAYWFGLSTKASQQHSLRTNGAAVQAGSESPLPGVWWHAVINGSLELKIPTDKCL